MARLIDTHPLRNRLDLDGLWAFAALDARGRPGAERRLPVPGVWETDLDHWRHRGMGRYRRTVEVPGERVRPARLVFEAVSHTATVRLDGRVVATHYGAHTAFAATLPALAPGAHELTVDVDNRFGEHHPLGRPNQDIYHWGGIPRSVRLELLPDVAIVEASAIPRAVGRGWMLDVTLRLQRFGDAPLPSTARVSLDGAAVGEIRIRRDGSGAGSVAVTPPGLWSPKNPRLSMVRIDAGDDAWQERVGFRTIAIDGRRILLNGEELHLRGVNRHEFHPDLGSAVTPWLHLKDLQILGKLGADFVRTAHYPNDELFLDLCDEHGVLVWEETAHWQPKAEDFRSERFLDTTATQIDEMVTQHRHHASIILWGMLNECDSDQAVARAPIKAFAKRFKRLDPLRPLTFASNKPFKDVCFDLVDIVAANVYPGWYFGDLWDLDERMDELLAALRTRGQGKPVILSEFGGAAIAGVRSFEDRKWTENFQAKLLQGIISRARTSGLVSGVSLWQYCDVRTSPAVAMGRAREYNNKGIVTERREPKEAFWAVRDEFAKPWTPIGRARRAKR